MAAESLMSEPQIDAGADNAQVDDQPRSRFEELYNIDRQAKFDFNLEIKFAIFSLVTISILAFIDLVFYLIGLDKLQPMIAVMVAGYVFLVGPMYSRANDRRESKKKRHWRYSTSGTQRISEKAGFTFRIG